MKYLKAIILIAVLQLAYVSIRDTYFRPQVVEVDDAGRIRQYEETDSDTTHDYWVVTPRQMETWKQAFLDTTGYDYKTDILKAGESVTVFVRPGNTDPNKTTDTQGVFFDPPLIIPPSR